MKNLNCLIVCLLISIVLGCIHPKINPPELPKYFEVEANKMESKIDSSFHLLIGPFTGNNPRAVLYPKPEGIPDSLSNIKKYLLPVDYVQAVFQAYKAGLINKNDCLNFLRKDVNDTVLCSADKVKTFVIIVTGISKKGHKYYLFDSNNNYDLSDEPLFIMTEKIPLNQPHKVLFEKFVNGKIQPDSTWIAFYGYKKTDVLLMRFCERVMTSFDFDSVQYNLVAYPTYGTGIKYADDVIDDIVFEISDSIHDKKQVFGYNQYAHLSDLYYQVSCSDDGRIITFNLDTNALEKGSTQINMPAIPFKAVTLKGDTVMFPKDFKGKYILLDFWSTSCPPCINDIRNCYRDLYKKYNGDKFEILGIADDPKNKVERFVSQNMIKWPMIPAPNSPIQESYRITGYPALYLIDPDGIIISKGQELRKEKIYDVIEKYLSQK
ncbi:MAG: TlpA family protein disulfide reductase [Bacteroidales bacterium]|nr:TlpA family protein disulfide reductase [Bacteroidales bacterium]